MNSYQEKIDNAREKRETALISKKGVYDNEAQLQNERDFHYRYLFGYSGNEGINDIISAYYQEMYIGVGRGSTTPNLRLNNNSDWTSRLESSITIEGDGSIYPDSDSNGVADDEINESSPWFTNNGDDGVNTGGAVADANAVETAIGTKGPLGQSSSETFGTGVLGYRFVDNFPISNTTDPETGDPITLYGDGTYDIYQGQGDWYNDPQKTTFESSLSTLISSLTSYKSQIQTIRGYLEKINNDNNQLFSEVEMSAPTGDISTISSLETTIQSYIDSLNSELSYFSQFTASDDITGQSGYDRTTFDNKLESTIPTLLSNIISTLQNRASNVPGLLGSTSSGLKQWRLFWISELIVKPDGALYALNGIGQAKIQANKKVENANISLNTLFGTPTEYFARPTITALYPNNIFNEDGSIAQLRNELLWIGSPAANKYRIYRRPLSGTPLNNTEWPSTYEYKWHVDYNPDSNMINPLLVDTNVSSGNTYVFRVAIYDTNEGTTSPINRTDSFNSSSLQSNIYDEDHPISFTGIVNGAITLLSEPERFVAGKFLLLLNSNGTDGFYQIESIAGLTVTLVDKTVNATTGEIYSAPSIIRI